MVRSLGSFLTVRVRLWSELEVVDSYPVGIDRCSVNATSAAACTDFGLVLSSASGEVDCTVCSAKWLPRKQESRGEANVNQASQSRDFEGANGSSYPAHRDASRRPIFLAFHVHPHLLLPHIF